MEKLKYFVILLSFLFFPQISSSQYALQQAFPNLPTFSFPIELVHSFDGTNRLFVAQQRGIIYTFNNSAAVGTRKTFINLSSKVSSSGSETGLLGLAFHPNYRNNRYFYVNYTFDSTGSGSGIWSRVSRFTTSATNPDSAVIGSELILITLAQPFTNHNGGKVIFGPDGYLYLSFGDGGSGGDPQHNGQNKSVLLGKILRINIDSASAGRNYSIPPTNPFFGNVLGYKEEIYAYGMRNTWKFSFDFPTNRLWAGDVGQNLYEEIDLIQNGKNYGWNNMEGFHCYGTCDTTGKGFIRPVFEYDHDTGQSITGGYLYRGTLLPALTGKYIYADYVQGTIWALTYDGINPTTNARVLDSSFNISSFGVDASNEIYVCSYSNGRIYRIANKNVSTLNLTAIIEGFYDTTSHVLNIRDTISVYLNQITSPFNVVDSAKTVIDSLTYSGACIFNTAPTGKYYIRLKHRNGLETWSRTGGDSIKKGNVVSYNFTTDSTLAFGNNEVLKGTKYCIYSGDVDQNGLVDLSDILLIYNDVLIFATGYKVTDLNGDRTVDLTDLIIDYNNSAKFVALIRP